MRKLPQTYPEIYDNVFKGHFVVKQSQGNFNAVAGDLKLEQTINRSQKSVGGIIGQTRQREYVTKWELSIMKFWQFPIGNPYVMLEPNFYNITSGEILDIIVQKFLNVFCGGLQQYKIFREERYI